MKAAELLFIAIWVIVIFGSVSAFCMNSESKRKGLGWTGEGLAGWILIAEGVWFIWLYTKTLL